ALNAGVRGVAGSFGGSMGRNQGVVEVRVFLNEWARFRSPGRYSVEAKTTRWQRPGAERTALQSNSIEIEVVEAPEGWAEATLARAVKTLEGAGWGPVSMEGREATRLLRYLGTPEATRALARMSTRVSDKSMALALWTTPHRALAIDEMERLLGDPAAAIHAPFLQTLLELAVAGTPLANKVGVAPDASVMRGRMERMARYLEIVREALPRKRPEVRVATALTLEQLRAPIGVEALRETLVAAPPLGQQEQYGLLTQLWPVIASPDVGPLLEKLAAEGVGATRALAYRRLLEIDPEAGRRRILEELRGAGLGSSSVLFVSILPDRELRELDEALIEKLRQPNPPWMVISRYGTRTLLPAVLAAMDRDPGGCHWEAIIYLLRVAPEEGRRRLEEDRRSKTWCGHFTVSSYSGAAMSEALEDVLIGELESGDAQRRIQAVQALSRFGTGRAEAPLWKAMERWRASMEAAPGAMTNEQQGEEMGLAMALSRGQGWLATAERLARVTGLCVSEQCRKTVESLRIQLGRPVRLGYMPGAMPEEWMLGTHQVRVPEGLRERLKMYGPEVEFMLHLPYRDSWLMRRMETQIREVFDEAGRKLTVADEVRMQR
ncbi:MAG TPA: hypothetical protein PLF84_23590, partial [Bryobacteraceae bacterium]|nr:hypothetical protein [Bryobacteraceae bacterium]